MLRNMLEQVKIIKYRCTNSKKFISRRTTCRLLKKL